MTQWHPEQQVPEQQAPEQQAPEQQAPEQQAPEQQAPEQPTSRRLTPGHQTPGEQLAVLSRGASAAEVMDFFDSLPPVPVDGMIGNWRGTDVPTGHPFDGVLGPLGWRGKRFDSAEAAHPLIFQTAAGKVFDVNPGFLPLRLALRLGPLVRRNPGLGKPARSVLPLARTTRPRARLRMMEYRGVASATMIYDALPVNDAFRKVDEDTLLGAMDMRGPGAPFMFSLHRIQ